MPNRIPTSPDHRKRLKRAFNQLPEIKKQNFYAMWEHLHYLMILWGLDDWTPGNPPTPDENKHLLLAYKSLEMIWFTKLPKSNRQPFEIYLRDKLPPNLMPETVNNTLTRTTEELGAGCNEMRRPAWLNHKDLKSVKVSLASFPYKPY
ncbi:MAG: hypothetical protein WCC12_21535 [Anaerolineales bacterium]